MEVYLLQSQVKDLIIITPFLGSLGCQGVPAPGSPPKACFFASEAMKGRICTKNEWRNFCLLTHLVCALLDEGSIIHLLLFGP